MTRKKWILLAEDNPIDAELILRALAESCLPPDVVAVRGGSEALNCLYHRNGFPTRHTGNPAVMLLGLKRPGVDGWEILSQIKSDARLKTIPVVVLSSSRDASDVARSYRLGANAYIVKPTQYRQLAAALEEVRAFWILINEPPPADLGNGNSNSELGRALAA